MPNTTIIVNPKAGQGKAIAKAERLQTRLCRSGEDCTTRVPDSKEDLRALAQEAVTQGVDVLVVAGGDGTVRDVLDIVQGTRCTLAVLGCGRGNDLARGLGAPVRALALAQRILSGRTRCVDLGSANGVLFGTVATCGLDAEVGQRTASGSRLGGSAGYLLQAVRSIRDFSGYGARVEIDGEVVHDGAITLVACANTPTYGGGLRVAPGAEVEDGRLDVCLVRRVSRVEAVGLLPQLAVGAHPAHPSVLIRSATQVRIETNGDVPMLLDGEPETADALEVSIRRGAIRVIA